MSMLSGVEHGAEQEGDGDGGGGEEAVGTRGWVGEGDEGNEGEELQEDGSA